MACYRVRGTEDSSVCPRYLKEINVIFKLGKVWSQVKQEGGKTASPINKVGLDLLNMALPIRIRSRFLQSPFRPLGSFHKLFIFICQRADCMKTTITGNYSN